MSAEPNNKNPQFNMMELLQKIDMEKVAKLSQKVDLGQVIDTISNLSDKQIQKLVKMLGANGGNEKPAPEVNSDFYDLSSTLTPEDRAVQLKIRKFMEEKVKPIVNEHWLHGKFPHDIIPGLAKLNVCGLPFKGYGCPGKSYLLEGVIATEMARVDASISTFFGVQSGLAMGSIYYCGSEEQKQQWLPKMQKFDILGAFGLTEPEVGSAVAGGLTTTAKREGDHWILNGQKKWIGNATFSDITIIWARDLDDNQVKGFIVENKTPGFKAEKIEDKMALRIVQNALITLDNCKISEENRLQNANSFKDTANVLRMTRASVAWQAVGLSQGAYEAALKYANQRKQFGKTIGSFQMIQDLLVQMLANLTSMQTMVYRLSQLQDQGIMTDEQASLAKVSCTMRTRDVVIHARELMGGNGILLSYDVARFVADAEAIYSYEGTKEINTLIVGRAITGKSAIV